MKTVLLDISGIKLEAAVKSRGMTLSYASLELGYSDNFLTQCKSRNKMNKVAVVGLQNRFGIPFEEYKYEPEPEPEIIKALQEEPTPEQNNGNIIISNIDYDRLANLIAGAIDYQKLCATIISAIKKVKEEA